MSVRKIVFAPPIELAMSAGVPASGSGEAGRAATVHEEPVERLRQRLHAVDVGHQREGRLRLADRDHLRGFEVAERRTALAYRPCDLREDVEREGVARVLQRSVALRIDRLEALAGGLGAGHVDPHRHRAAFDADDLGADPDPRVALPHDLLRRVAYSGSASTPPLTFNHSTRTTPLASPASAGRRTITRVR